MSIRQKLSKYLIILFAFILTFSNMEFIALHADSLHSTSANPSIAKTALEDDKTAYQPTDKVRVVVELEEKSGVMFAQDQNKKYSELSKHTRSLLHERSLNEQEDVKQMLQSEKISIKYLDNFTAIFNGFSAEVLYKDIEVIETIDRVKAVYISEEYERPVEPPTQTLTGDLPETTTGNEVVNAPLVWNNIGYKGEGMVVAVLDDGIDIEHRDMILSEETEPSFTREYVEEAIENFGLLGEYFTEKVPFGYNYSDQNNIIKDIGEGANNHGMHVAGIVGANGDPDNGGIKGVAPEAQLLAMKVFSNDQGGTTSSDIYVKAIDDAVKLNVDAINMSFGSAGRILNPEDPAQIAAKRATENGIFVSKSAGNGYYFGEKHDELPYAANPDIGVVSNAQLAEAAAEIANFENSHLDYPAFVYSIDGQDQIIPFNPASSAPSPDDAIDENEREVVYAGYGRMPGDSDEDPEANDFEGLDLEGKIALIQRGGGAGFVDKTLNAQKHGADAVVIFNNQDSGYSNMASDPAVEIPQVFILKEHGEDIVQQLENGTDVTIAFKGDRAKTDNPQAGQMSGSTSWGPMGGLDFKPVISAVGSQVLSTLNDDEYGIKSGTSMAAPQAAGGATLVMMRLNEEFDISGLDLTMMTKNILMNTAKPVENISDVSKEFGIEGVPYSPRRQGAGLMDLYDAVTTPVVITEKESGQGAAALKEIDDVFTFTLEAVNYSDDDVVYHVKGNVQTDLAEGKYNYLESVGVVDENGDIPLTYNSDHGESVNDVYQVTVPAQETVQLDVTVDLTGAVDEYLEQSIKEIFVNGRFIEGFIEFFDPKDVHPELSVPYVGFYGDWSKPPVLDEFIYNSEDSFYGKAGMVTDLGMDEYPYLGIDPITEEATNRYAISPTNETGVNNIIPALTFLRNAQEVQFTIEDEDGTELTHLDTKIRVRKHLNPSSSAYTIFDDVAWDGTINDEVVKDGLYYYVIKTLIPYEHAEWQVKKVPVYIDTEKPSVQAVFNQETNEVGWNAEDNGSGIASIDILVNDESASGLLSPDETGFTIEDKIYHIHDIKIVVTDWAGNQNIVTVYDPDPSASYLTFLIEHLETDEEISSEAVHALTLHLTAVDRFESQEAAEKVVKHMESFKLLLEHQKDRELLSDEAYHILNEQSNLLTEKWMN